MSWRSDYRYMRNTLNTPSNLQERLLHIVTAPSEISWQLGLVPVCVRRYLCSLAMIFV